MVRVAHLSDIHFGGENRAAMDAVAGCLAACPPDLVAITGDLTTSGQPAEFASALAWIRTLPFPALIVPGNHDTPYMGLAERLIAPFERFERSFGPPRGVRWASSAAVVMGLNTARGMQWRWNWSKGAVSRGDVDAIVAGMLEDPQSVLRVVLCHHPLVEMIGGPMTARVRGGEAAARMFSAAGVDLILSGHIHAPFAMALPHGDGRTWAVGAGTLSLRERGVPAGFNIIEADASTITVTAMAWARSHFEVWRTWSLERRADG